MYIRNHKEMLEESTAPKYNIHIFEMQTINKDITFGRYYSFTEMLLLEAFDRTHF